MVSRKRYDLTGHRYGKLTVIKDIGVKGKGALWECRCDCGNIVYATPTKLRNGLCCSCGCEPNGQRIPWDDLTGQRFGKLTVIKPAGKTNSEGLFLWECRCDCGNVVEVASHYLKNGNNRSCGCLKIKAQKMVRERLHIIDGTCLEWITERKRRTDNRSGHPGVFRKQNGKYTASIGFKKKVYFIGTYETYDEALSARLSAEDNIYGGFVDSYGKWKKIAESDPVWAQENPFTFDVCRDNGKFLIRKSI